MTGNASLPRIPRFVIRTTHIKFVISLSRSDLLSHDLTVRYQAPFLGTVLVAVKLASRVTKIYCIQASF